MNTKNFVRKKHYSQIKHCYLTSTAHLQQGEASKGKCQKHLASSGERGLASSNSVSPFHQFPPLPPSSSCSQNKPSCSASQGEHSIYFETRARGQMLAQPICVSSGQTALSLPSPSGDRAVWVEQTGCDSCTHTPGTTALLSWGSWDFEQGSHRLQRHQSQRKVGNQQRIRYWYGSKGSPCTRLTAGFLQITKAFLEAGMQVLQDSLFSFCFLCSCWESWRGKRHQV